MPKPEKPLVSLDTTPFYQLRIRPGALRFCVWRR